MSCFTYELQRKEVKWYSNLSTVMCTGYSIKVVNFRKNEDVLKIIKKFW